ncbi:MAG: HEAT repeat domain-containing protein [Spirulinaceae cyanobacterium RM2_2_10]|nr:HEAT repeat domain-containing protein [Spirulinaceae cyanobacterium SM2_1_0]NJO20743.1 HEAT repeat domain-containing protein [Spirulinaceae cyanobacterium RM2_2_10]
MVQNVERPLTRAVLQARATRDPDPQSRMRAINELVRCGSDNDDTLTLLKSIAQSDEDPHVIATAMAALAKGWREDSATLAWFKTYAQYAQNPLVRSVAIEELARGWHSQCNVFEILSKCAFVDPFRRQHESEVNPRQRALAAMIEQYPSYHQTWALVEERAENDADPLLRQYASQQLATHAPSQ